MRKRLFLFLTIVWMGSAWGYADTSVDYSTIFTDSIYNTCFFWYDDEEAWKTIKEMQKYSCYRNWSLYLHLENGCDVKRGCFVEYGDTIVEGRHYQRVTFIGREDVIVGDETWPGSRYHYDFTPDCVDTLLYRQDGDKVYCRTSGGEEQTILDYSLSVGDVFTDATGERFNVTETGFLEEYSGSVEYRNGSNLPKTLRLVSENGGQEDVWIEGIGSVNWGITPLFLIGNLKTLTAAPAYSKLICSTGTNIKGVFNINKDNYKTKYFCPVWSSHQMDTGLSYTFQEDTLCVSGVYFRSPSNLYAECAVLDNNIDLFLGGISTAMSVSSEVNPGSYCKVNVKIPGFKAGTYQVGLEGGAHQALVCNPTNGIALTPAVSQGEGSVYALSGRKVSDGQLKKGIYIKGGKKVMVK